MKSENSFLDYLSGCFIALLMFFSFTAVAQAPLTRDELIDLCHLPSLQNNYSKVLNDFVRRNKIAFLPTKRAVAYLNDNGVPKVITDELKHNFSSRIVYRVCIFQPKEGEGLNFANLLSSAIATQKELHPAKEIGGLLANKTFNPQLAEYKGLTDQELAQNPNSGYILIKGIIEENAISKKKEITAFLIFVSKAQPEQMSIGAPLTISIDDTNTSFTNAAIRIARWSLDEVVRQVQ